MNNTNPKSDIEIFNNLNNYGESGHEEIEFVDAEGDYYPVTASRPNTVTWFKQLYYKPVTTNLEDQAKKLNNYFEEHKDGLIQSKLDLNKFNGLFTSEKSSSIRKVVDHLFPHELTQVEKEWETLKTAVNTARELTSKNLENSGKDSKPSEVKKIINSIVNEHPELNTLEKENLKNSLSLLFESSFENLSSLYIQQAQIDNKLEINEDTLEIVKQVEEYEPLLEEFKDVKLEELFQEDPRIEAIAQKYLEEKFYEELHNNPGALAGFILGLEIMKYQINIKENKDLFEEFKGHDVKDLIEENSKTEKFVEEHKKKEFLSEKIDALDGENPEIALIEKSTIGLTEKSAMDTGYGKYIKMGVKMAINQAVTKPQQSAIISIKEMFKSLLQLNFRKASTYAVYSFTSVYCACFKSITLRYHPNLTTPFEGEKSNEYLKTHLTKKKVKQI